MSSRNMYMYMPCDAQFNSICEEYLDVLNELELL